MKEITLNGFLTYDVSMTETRAPWEEKEPCWNVRIDGKRISCGDLYEESECQWPLTEDARAVVALFRMIGRNWTARHYDKTGLPPAPSIHLSATVKD